MKPTRSSLAAALASIGIAKIEPRQPGEWTVAEAVETSGQNRCFVERRLAEGLKAGKVSRRRAIIDGRASWLYRETKGKPPALR